MEYLRIKSLTATYVFKDEDRHFQRTIQAAGRLNQNLHVQISLHWRETQKWLYTYLKLRLVLLRFRHITFIHLLLMGKDGTISGYLTQDKSPSGRVCLQRLCF